MRNLWGYYDLGPVQVPPLPQLLVFTDRGDGTLWLLTRTGDTDDDRVSITDDLPASLADVTVFGPYDGPSLWDEPRARLLVRDGHLGYDDAPLPRGNTDRDYGRVLIRVGRGIIWWEIITPAGWVLGDPLGYETELDIP